MVLASSEGVYLNEAFCVHRGGWHWSPFFLGFNFFKKDVYRLKSKTDQSIEENLQSSGSLLMLVQQIWGFSGFHTWHAFLEFDNPWMTNASYELLLEAYGLKSWASHPADPPWWEVQPLHSAFRFKNTYLICTPRIQFTFDFKKPMMPYNRLGGASTPLLTLVAPSTSFCSLTTSDPPLPHTLFMFSLHSRFWHQVDRRK